VWDGTSWSPFTSGTGIDQGINAVCVRGDDLVIGGLFTSVDGVAAQNVALFSGGAWHALDSGTGSLDRYGPRSVFALAASGGRAIIGGEFETAGGSISTGFASWGLSCYADCDCSPTPPVLSIADFACFLDRFVSGSAYANCDGSTTPPVLNVADFTCFLQRYAAGCP
jgi:hypothetical protein